ncbi:phosphatase PAP2 family protein [Tumebacillus sp. ITR2]|uniref:Phosphatase PAP2 family protein n=1 Tax=Tumebacillus amylolyticus TaxID=2801339 RepID=A0ABS1JB14_9BACL|nr:phosphatase PAP2 family protein [Tumebacillus amylolyticus]MBL0386803.1 phosphatase PAP2 family protein [Tumebacillus amylolyticus]
MKRMTRMMRNGDIVTFFWLNRSWKNEWLDGFMPLVTHLGGAVWCIVLSLALLVHPNDVWHEVGVHLALALGISHAVVAFCKKAMPRKRPYLALENVSTGHKLWKDASFPSGHTTAVFSMATVLSAALPDVSLLFYALAFLIGSSRVYLGQHYPSDVVTGALIGTVTAWMIV